MSPMPLLRLALMLLLACAADVSTPLVPEAFGLEDTEEAAHRALRRPRLASIRRETSGPALARQVIVRRVVVDRREAAARPERRGGVEPRKVPSPAPEPSSPEAH